MRRFLIFLLLFYPVICSALDDACTKPDEYKIERRCYVDDNMWQKAPYKYVLKMYSKSKDRVFCAANMVSGKIVTAKHCLENDQVSDIEFIAFDGKKISVKNNDYVMGTGDFRYNDYEDWAVLTPISEDSEFVINNSINDTASFDVGDYWADGSFISTGCGQLKILSDKEIEAFKKAYLEYLEEHAEELRGSFLSDNEMTDHKQTIKISSIKALLKADAYFSKYGFTVKDIFWDQNNLKASVCDSVGVSFNNIMNTSCKAFCGDSGGGIYQTTNNQQAKNNLVSDTFCDDNSCRFTGVAHSGHTKTISSNPEKHVVEEMTYVGLHDDFKKALQKN